MKILINSYPRSGTTTLVDAIRLSCFKETVKFGEDFFHKKNWIAKSHIPVIFLGEFPKNIFVGTIARDPLDAISSNCFRWSNGYTGNIVQGKIVIDKNRESQENKFDEVLKDLIKHQTEQYISYYSCIQNGSKNIKIFSYEDIQQRVDKVIDKILHINNYEDLSVNYELAFNVIKNPPQPTKEKTELYYQIRDYIKSLELIDQCYFLYNEILTKKENAE